MKSKKRLWLIVAVLLCILAIPAMGLATEETNVCQIVETGTSYTSIEAALENVENNQTIKLIADVDLTQTLEVGTEKNFTLDINGYVLNGSEIDEPKEDGDKGSIIFNQGNITIKDSNPENEHTGTSLPKGGVLTGGKGIQKYSTTIIGGAIYNGEDGTLTLQSGTITDNNSTYYGSGIYNDGILNLKGGTLSGNEALYGGAIYSHGTINFEGGMIKGNSAGVDGGGVYISYGTMNMSGGTITENTSISGGGISIGGGYLTITDGMISNNTAAYQCGAIACGNLEQSQVIITGGTISGNSAPIAAGISSNTIWNNEEETRNYYAGNYIVVGGTAKIQGNILSNSEIESNIDVRYFSIQISSDHQLSEGANIGITDRYNKKAFANSVKEGDSGYFHSDLPETTMQYENGSLKSVHEKGLTFVVTKSNGTGKGTLFEAVYCAQEGDTIKFADEVKRVFLSTTLPYIYHSISIDGGNGVTLTINRRAFFIREAQEVRLNQLTFDNDYISETWCDNSGIDIKKSGLFVNNCIFKNNLVIGTNFGGAAINGCDSTLEFNNCLFDNNSSDHNGGAISVTDCETKITNCTMVGNSSESAGNAIYIYASAEKTNTTTISNSIIVNNTGSDSEVVTEGPGISDIYFYHVLGTANNWKNLDAASIGSGENIEWDTNINNLFVDLASKDFHIKKDSQAYEKGDNVFISENNKIDLDRKTRIIGTNVEIGCYEFGYIISKDTIENGKIACKTGNYEISGAGKDEIISVIATPNEFYELDEIKAWKTGAETTKVTVNENGTFTMPDFDVTVSATFKPKSYGVTINKTIENGDISVTKDGQAVSDVAEYGSTIKVVANPDKYYKLEKITVYKTGEPQTIVSEGSDQFEMPGYDVTITATFKETEMPCPIHRFFRKVKIFFKNLFK